MAKKKKKEIEIEVPEFDRITEPPVIRPIVIKTIYLNKSLLVKKRKPVKSKKEQKPVSKKTAPFDYNKFVSDSITLLSQDIKEHLYQESKKVINLQSKVGDYNYSFSFNYDYAPKGSFDFSNFINSANKTVDSINSTRKNTKGTYVIKGAEYKDFSLDYPRK